MATIPRSRVLGIPLGTLLAALAMSACAGPAGPRGGTPLSLPGAAGGPIGFDDLRYAASLDRILVPAGRTGLVYLLNPAGGAASPLRVFPPLPLRGSGHGTGVTSADFGAGLVFAADRNALTLKVISPRSGKIVEAVPLAGRPDYVRYVSPTREIWVTEPPLHQIEIFSLYRNRKAPRLKPSGTVSVPGGPESLVVDSLMKTAYTTSRGGSSFAISLGSRRIKARWKNGCAKSSGLAFDQADGLLFVACREGQARALDARRGGRPLATLAAGPDVDIIAYDSVLRHLYVPSARSATLVVAAVDKKGQMTPLRTVRTAPQAHCVIAHGGRFWVCDPRNGRLLSFADR